MNTEEVVQFIKEADAETRSIIRAALKNPPPRVRALDLCKEYVDKLIEACPFTTDEYKGYRYEETAMYYVHLIKDLTNLCTHNFTCRHNSRGYPVWTGADDVSKAKEEVYKATFKCFTTLVLDIMNQLDTRYDTAGSAQNPPDSP